MIKPITSRASSSTTLPLLAMTYPPPISRIRSIATIISASLSPTTIRLCESCAKDDAIAPFFKLKPFKIPIPFLPDALYRSIQVILLYSALGLNSPFSTGTSSTVFCVTICPGTILIIACGPSTKTSNLFFVKVPILIVCSNSAGTTFSSLTRTRSIIFPL